MELFEAPPIYERVIHEDTEKMTQVRFTVSTFRGVEYLSVREYYLDFSEEWKPTPKGVNFPISFANSKELFHALIEILSLAESKEVIQEHFQELFTHLED